MSNINTLDDALHLFEDCNCGSSAKKETESYYLGDQIAAEIARRRKELGLSQNDLASQLCVSPNTVDKWESAQERPTIGMLSGIAAALASRIKIEFV